nr:MAG TPA: hypothetical protein [Caudoviricetes sp.]
MVVPFFLCFRLTFRSFRVIIRRQGAYTSFLGGQLCVLLCSTE